MISPGIRFLTSAAMYLLAVGLAHAQTDQPYLETHFFTSGNEIDNQSTTKKVLQLSQSGSGPAPYAVSETASYGALKLVATLSSQGDASRGVSTQVNLRD